MPWALSEPAIEDLTREALKLLSFERGPIRRTGMSAVGSGATDASRAYARLAHRSAQSRIAGR